MNYFIQSTLKKRRVLVVDDEYINRELLDAVLSMDYEVVTACDGKQAMDTLYAATEPFSLILLDLLMPNMTGFRVIEACKDDEKLRDIPIIVMTSEKSAEVRSIQMGADDFIAKPYRMPEVIIARCERIIELSEEKALIRSIEKDPVTGLYIEVFFKAYIRRVLPDLNTPMDAMVLRVDCEGGDGSCCDKLCKKLAELLEKDYLRSRGMACRAHDNTFLVFCAHYDNYAALLEHMQTELASLSPDGHVTLKAGMYSHVDLSQPIDSWFEKAADNPVFPKSGGQ